MVLVNVGADALKSQKKEAEGKKGRKGIVGEGIEEGREGEKEWRKERKKQRKKKERKKERNKQTNKQREKGVLSLDYSAY